MSQPPSSLHPPANLPENWYFLPQIGSPRPDQMWDVSAKCYQKAKLDCMPACSPILAQGLHQRLNGQDHVQGECPSLQSFQTLKLVFSGAASRPRPVWGGQLVTDDTV